jgi:purine/pyrimidine-nucleoside phosphorylase
MTPTNSSSTTAALDGHIQTRANVYFDGKCVSHSVTLADGSKKSVGVILPSTLTFNTGAPETMELVEGQCRVKLAGENGWVTFEGGQSFNVPAQSSFEIEAFTAVHYVCHFG